MFLFTNENMGLCLYIHCWAYALPFPAKLSLLVLHFKHRLLYSLFWHCFQFEFQVLSSAFPGGQGVWRMGVMWLVLNYIFVTKPIHKVPFFTNQIRKKFLQQEIDFSDRKQVIFSQQNEQVYTTWVQILGPIKYLFDFEGKN